MLLRILLFACLILVLVISIHLDSIFHFICSKIERRITNINSDNVVIIFILLLVYIGCIKIVVNIFDKDPIIWIIVAVVPLIPLLILFIHNGIEKANKKEKLERWDSQTHEIRKSFPLAFEYYCKKHELNYLSPRETIEKLLDKPSSEWQMIEEQLLKRKKSFEIFEKQYPNGMRIWKETYQKGADGNFEIIIPEESEVKFLEDEYIELQHTIAKKQVEVLNRRKNELLNNLNYKSLDTVYGIHLYYFFTYFPVRYESITNVDKKIRQLIWNFKDGLFSDTIYEILTKKLDNIFGGYFDLLTFVCIPASYKSTNEKRYKSFMEKVCKKTGMSNAYNFITIAKEKKPSHLGGSSQAEYIYDNNYFKNRLIILFDDIVTSGYSMYRMKEDLENNGAKVVAAFALGKTYDTDKLIFHPYLSENHEFELRLMKYMI